MKPRIPLTTLLSVRRALLVGAFAIAGVTLLQGCVPVIVAGGVGATALMASDRRTAGTYIDDESIEWKVADRMRKHFGTINNINVTSYNRTMLLTGEVQDEGVRAEAQRLAGTVTNVRAVVNELVVAPPSTLSSRSNDTTITANIKARFVNNKVFSPNHVKIVTEAGVAFLLGVVTHAEGDHAAEIARTSRGVSKVVKVFEYTDENRSHHGNGFPPEAP